MISGAYRLKKEEVWLITKDILSDIIILFTRVHILCYISKGKIYVQNGKIINISNWGGSQREQLNVDSSGTRYCIVIISVNTVWTYHG